MDLPKLREVDAFPVTVSGQKMIGLRDPANFTTEIMAVPHHFYPMLCLLDGRHSIADIQAEYMRKFGELIYREMIEDTVRKLDEALFLDSDTFHRRREQIVREFKRARIRPAMLAGKSYDVSPERLALQIDGFFTHADGPGLPARRLAKPALKGVIAPHIDFLRGGPCFAWAYKQIAEQSDAEVFVILGTAHAQTNKPFVLTYKDFETPFGTMKCDRELVKQIMNRVSYDLMEDEFVHRGEHSIEFQTTFLGYLCRERNDVSIVPVLCGSFHEMIFSRTNPSENPAVTEFVDALTETVRESRKTVCYIAGADLAHVGPRFGDRHPISDAFLRLLRADDLRMISAVEKLDAKGFFANIEADGDRRKICGLPPIYTMLSVMEAKEGKLLRYDQWADPNGTVTFASMAFY